VASSGISFQRSLCYRFEPDSVVRYGVKLIATRASTPSSPASVSDLDLLQRGALLSLTQRFHSQHSGMAPESPHRRKKGSAPEERVQVNPYGQSAGKTHLSCASAAGHYRKTSSSAGWAIPFLFLSQKGCTPHRHVVPLARELESRIFGGLSREVTRQPKVLFGRLGTSAAKLLAPGDE
jgi:hypothetical protein